MVNPETPHQSNSDVRFEVESLSHTFGRDKLALRDLSFSVKQGEFVSILGPSGCGKSTFLRILAGLEAPSQGEIRHRQPKSRSFVFQDAHLLPWRTALQNVVLPLELQGADHRAAFEKAKSILEELGLSASLNRMPHELSGGMKMRVSLARALITNPDLLLLDEPLAALDEVIRMRLGELLRALWSRRRMTVVLVTHSISEAVFLSNRVMIMSPTPGRIVEDQTLALPDERTAALRESTELAKLTQHFSRIMEKGGHS